jgi:long-chain acyl-CoA synthetase
MNEDSFQTPDFKFIISVAAQLEERLWNTVSTIFKVQIVNVYGLTETVNGSLCGPKLNSL